MVQRFDVEVASSPSACLLSVCGELDLISSPKLVVAGREAVRSGARRVCVNLGELTFIDSAGLAALINLQRSVERAGGHLTVVCPAAGPVRQLFATTGTERLLNIEPPSQPPSGASVTIG